MEVIFDDRLVGGEARQDFLQRHRGDGNQRSELGGDAVEFRPLLDDQVALPGSGCLRHVQRHLRQRLAVGGPVVGQQGGRLFRRERRNREVLLVGEQVDQSPRLGAFDVFVGFHRALGLEQHGDQLAVDGLFVADKTDLVGLRVDGRALRFDDFDGLLVEIDGGRLVAFLFGNAGAVVEDQPVDLAVFPNLRNLQQFVEAGLGFGLPAGFEQGLVDHEAARQFRPGPVAHAAKQGAADQVVDKGLELEGAVAVDAVKRPLVFAERHEYAAERHRPGVGVVGTAERRGVDARQFVSVAFAVGAVAVQRRRQRQGRHAVDHHVEVLAVLLAQPLERLLRLGDGRFVLAELDERVGAHDVDGRRGVVEAEQTGAQIALADVFGELVEAGQQLVVAFGLRVGEAQRVAVAGVQRMFRLIAFDELLQLVEAAIGGVFELLAAAVGMRRLQRRNGQRDGEGQRKEPAECRLAHFSHP